jgi:hypothetical protein
LPGEAQAPIEEVAVGQRQRRRDQPGDIHHGARTDQDAIRVDQEHPAVGLQAPEDLGHLRTGHPIQDGAGGVLLDEAHQFVGRDRETLPVDDRAGRVGDLQRIGGRTGELRGTGGHLRTRG